MVHFDPDAYAHACDAQAVRDAAWWHGQLNLTCTGRYDGEVSP
jgi:hypothetical protein